MTDANLADLGRLHLSRGASCPGASVSLLEAIDNARERQEISYAG